MCHFRQLLMPITTYPLVTKPKWIFLFISLFSAYEHAVLAAGTDFRSDRLWESYINWETEQEKLVHVTNIYDRILGIPTQLYSQHFQRYATNMENDCRLPWITFNSLTWYLLTYCCPHVMFYITLLCTLSYVNEHHVIGWIPAVCY